jgi:uncharacterized protein
MNIAQQLDILQDLDLDIDRLRNQLAAIQAGYAEPASLIDARDAATQADGRLSKARKAAQDREWDVKDGQARANTAEARLYSGAVTNAKELANIQKEVESLKARLVTLEEKSLETTASLGEAQVAANAAHADLDTATDAWNASVTRLKQEEASVTGQIAAKQARRATQAASIDAPSLAIYTRLRPQKGGRAVAKLKGDRCEGCRLTLPAGIPSRAKSSQALVYCVNCGRILAK